MLSIRDKSGKEYKFENHPKYNVELYSVRGGRIVGSYMNKSNNVEPFTVNFSGANTWGQIKLIPHDQFKALKQAFLEDAIIHYGGDRTTVSSLRDFDSHPDEYDRFYIKGHISLESWKAHKGVIKAFWAGKVIEFKSIVYPFAWELDSCEEWLPSYQYRVKPQAREMNIEEISKELGYDIKVVK